MTGPNVGRFVAVGSDFMILPSMILQNRLSAIRDAPRKSLGIVMASRSWPSSFVSKIMVGKIIKAGVDPPLYQIGTARRASRTCRLRSSVAQSASCARRFTFCQIAVDTKCRIEHNPAPLLEIERLCPIEFGFPCPTIPVLASRMIASHVGQRQTQGA